MKALTIALAFAAAVSAWRAAVLWLRASRVPLPPFDPPATSMADDAAGHILCAVVDLNATKQALDTSAALNARAARWAALSAALTGVAVVLGAL